MLKGTMTGSARGWIATAIVVASPASTAAQKVVVGAGVSGYDLSGTGTTWVASARYEAPVGGPLALDIGATVLRYEPQGGGHLTYLIPEVGLHASAPLGPVTVSLGAGGGIAQSVEGPDDREATLFGTVGVEVPLGAGWSLRPEARLRAIDPWTGTTGDLTLGVARKIGGPRRFTPSARSGARASRRGTA